MVKVKWNRLNGFVPIYVVHEVHPLLPNDIGFMPIFRVFKYDKYYEYSTVGSTGRMCVHEDVHGFLDKKMRVKDVKAYIETLMRMKGVDIEVVK